MNPKKNGFLLQLLQVILALLLGVLLTLTWIKAGENKRLRNVRYHDWQKLNVILGEIERNYVGSAFGVPASGRAGEFRGRSRR